MVRERTRNVKLTTIGRDIILEQPERVLRVALEVVLLAREHLVHLGTSLLTAIGLDHLVTRVTDNSKHDVILDGGLLVLEEAEITIKGTVDLDEGNIAMAVVAAGDPLGSCDNVLGQTELDTGRLDAAAALVSDVALDLDGLAETTAKARPVKDIVAGSDHDVRGNQPASAHGEALLLGALTLVADDQLDDGCMSVSTKQQVEKRETHSGTCHRRQSPSCRRGSGDQDR